MYLWKNLLREFIFSQQPSWDMDALAKEEKVQIILSPLLILGFDELAIDLASYIRENQIQRLVLIHFPP